MRLGWMLGLAMMAGCTTAAAQSGIIPPPNLTAPPPASNRPIPDAPVGHRQPRASDLPQQDSRQIQDDENARQDAALDRRMKGICRGC